MGRKRGQRFFSATSAGRRPRAPSGLLPRSDTRRLRFEPLEDRRMLAIVTVGNTLDVVNGNTSSIAALVANAGADGISFREAILATNATTGSDQIRFAPELAGQTITLGGTALPQLTDELDIVGVDGLTVFAPNTSHMVDVAAGVIAQISDLTFMGGARNAHGGAIANFGHLILNDVTLTNNTSIGGNGGAIYNHAGAILNLHHTSVVNNIAGGFGGGIANFGTLTVDAQSSISNNIAYGGGGGGIINAGAATIYDATINENQAVGSTTAAQGGGIYSSSLTGGVTLERVTLHGNVAIGSGVDGPNGGSGSNGYRDAFGTLVAAVDGGDGSPGGVGQAAEGGGLYSGFGYVSLIDTTIDSNIARGGNGGNGGSGGTAGDGAVGGSYFLGTFSGSAGAAGGDGGDGGTGGSATGGGLFISNFTSEAFQWTGLTLTGNEARGGKGGNGGHGGRGGHGGEGVDGYSQPFGAEHEATSGGHAGNGGLAGSSGAGGSASGGGMFYVAPPAGTLDVWNSSIIGNRAVGGAGGLGGNGGNGGHGGSGGNGTIGALVGLQNAGHGGNGGNTSNVGFARGGGDAEGGGIRQSGGNLNLVGATIASNEATGALGGTTGSSGAYGLGGAGGIAALGGANGANGTPGGLGGVTVVDGNGGNALGGGIHASGNATTTVRNSTVASNLATGGVNGWVAGSPAPLSYGGRGAGGALYVIDATVNLSHATVSLNHVHGGDGLGPLTEGSPDGAAEGGGIWTVNDPGAATALNYTIVAGNLGTHPATGTGPSDLSGVPVTAGSVYNLIGTGGAGGLIHGTNFNQVGIANPMLGPLTDNGGSTLTMRPLVGSPAIDAGDVFFQPFGDILLDQRGQPRVLQAGPAMTNDLVGLAEIKFGATDGQVITPSVAFARSYYSNDQIPDNLVNNSGLTAVGNVMQWTHASNVNAHGMWVAGNGKGVGGPAPVVEDQYILLSLGSPASGVDLSTAYLWQMVQTNVLGRGIKEFRIYGSSSAVVIGETINPPNLANYNLLLDSATLAPGPQSGPSTTQAFALTGATNVRKIYIEVISSYNTGSPRIDIGAVEATKPLVATEGEFFVGLTPPSAPLPSVRFTFNESIDEASVSPADLESFRYATPGDPGETIHATGVSIDGNTITFTLPTNLQYGAHRAALAAGSVADVLGNPLEAALAFDFDYDHTFFLPGDANFDTVVDDADYQILVANYGQSPRNFSQGNFDESADGVGADDLALLAGNYQPGPQPFFEPNVPSHGSTVLHDVYVALPKNPAGLGLEDFEISRNGGAFVSLEGNPGVGFDFMGPENRVAHLLTNFTLSLPGVYRIRLNPAGWTSDNQTPLPAELTYRYNVVDGDFNLDGVVDAADFTVWRNTLGTVGIPLYSGADGNGNGLVDTDDYLVWKANYGRTMVLGAAAAATMSATVDNPPPAERAAGARSKPSDPESFGDEPIGAPSATAASSVAGKSGQGERAALSSRMPEGTADEQRRHALDYAVWSGAPLTTPKLVALKGRSEFRAASTRPSASPSAHHHDTALLLWLTSQEAPKVTRLSPLASEEALEAFHDQNADGELAAESARRQWSVDHDSKLGRLKLELQEY